MADIEFKCAHCGQVLECDGDMAGESVECPACGKTLVVPLPGGIVVRTPSTCPDCGSVLPDNAVLCVQCGYHLKLGRRIKTNLG